jgi:positive regulator of sigma E activity
VEAAPVTRTVAGVELWIAVGAILVLILVTLRMRRYRRRLEAKRRDGSEPEREQAGP